MLDRVIPSDTAPLALAPTVRLSRTQWTTILRLKSWTSEHRRATEPIILEGQSLPTRAGTTKSGSLHVLCLAPGEWLIFTKKSLAELKAQLLPALRLEGIAFTDWSDALVTLLVEGPLARTLLSQACGLDLDPKAFPPGHCARTRFAQIPVILQSLSESRCELSVAGSYFGYLHEWLSDSNAEWSDIITI
jgi:sarcosine oxidase subunit gamma